MRCCNSEKSNRKSLAVFFLFSTAVPAMLPCVSAKLGERGRLQRLARTSTLTGYAKRAYEVLYRPPKGVGHGSFVRQTGCFRVATKCGASGLECRKSEGPVEEESESALIKVLWDLSKRRCRRKPYGQAVGDTTGRNAGQPVCLARRQSFSSTRLYQEAHLLLVHQRLDFGPVFDCVVFMETGRGIVSAAAASPLHHSSRRWGCHGRGHGLLRCRSVHTPKTA